MAKNPSNQEQGDTPQKPERDLSQEMLMREVDEAVRVDEVTSAVRKYGVPVGTLLVLALAAFGAYLFWQDSSETALEEQSETIITALDELEAGNRSLADEELAALSDEGSPGARSSALMIRAGIALEEGRDDDAVVFFDRIFNDPEAPQALRDAARIRATTVKFDELDPQEVIDRLGPLATADNPWFGSAGEMVAMAYLAQDKPEQAGPLLVEISQNEDVPPTIASRARQLAGLLGYDAVEDVDEILSEMAGAKPGDGAAQ